MSRWPPDARGGGQLYARKDAAVPIAQDLRSALDRFADADELTHITAPVSPKFEISAVLWALHDGKAAIFDNVEGYGHSVVGNVLNHRSKLALACGVPLHSLQHFATEAYRSPRPPVRVSDAPCQEVVISEGINLAEMWPIPQISEFDAGRFITAGLLIAKDPVRGRINLAIARLQVKGANRLGCFLAPTDTFHYLQRHRENGTVLQVAIAIGNHPVVMAASQMPPPDDELLFAGGLFGAGVEMAPCVSVDLEVPAHAEIVLEGFIDPALSEPEGPFGEFGGHYNASDASPVIEVSTVTSRRDALFQTIVGGTHPEHSVTGVFAREVRLLETIRQAGPVATAVSFPVGGTCRFQAIIALRNARPSDAVSAILAAFNFSPMLRQVVVVDEDVDVFDREQVDWAFASCMDPTRDLVIVDRCKAHPRDPAQSGGVVAKVGFDATRSAPQVAATERTMPDVPEGVRDDVLNRLGWS